MLEVLYQSDEYVAFMEMGWRVDSFYEKNGNLYVSIYCP